MQNNRRLMKLLGLVPALFILASLFGFLASGLVVLQSSSISKVIDQVFLENKSLTDVLPILSWVLIIILLRFLFTILNGSLISRVSVRIRTYLREQLLLKIDRLGPAYLRMSKSGELITSALQGVDALDAYFSQYLPQIIIAVLLPLTILAVVFPLDLVSGLVFLVTAPLIPFFMALVGRSSEAQTKKQWQALSRLGADFLDTLQGLTTLKTLGRSREYADHVAEVSDRYRIATMNVLRITFLSAFVLELLATISTAVVAVEIGLRLLYGKILFEQAFFILLIAPEFYLPMRNLGMRYHAGMTGVTAAGRIFEVLDIPETRIKTVGHSTSELPAPNGSSLIEFREVSFTYPQRESEALRSTSLQIECGRHYVLAGHSGAGKSTILQLIMRFLEPSSGTVLFNGIDIAALDLTAWRRSISWVPQTPKLFDTNLLENVRLNNPDISEERVWQALEAAQLADFARHLPEGLNTPLHEWGSRLSGGQGQRVALARAFVKDSSLLLMDEPTSHLDPILEASFEKASRKLLENRTSVTIAHRPSTLKNADTVFVIDGGRLVQSGDPRSLSSQDGPFRQFFSGEGKVA